MIKKEAKVILIILLIFILFMLLTFFGFFSYFLDKLTGNAVTSNSTTICGNGVCEYGETVLNCPSDCIVAPFSPSVCGNGYCESDENDTSCPADCQQPPNEETGGCGNGICNPWEDYTTCPQDCSVEPAGDTECGNVYCEPGEDAQNCPQDCFCGDGMCGFDETAITCPADCESPRVDCGDGNCDSSIGETLVTCPADCLNIPNQVSVCGNGYCESDETPTTCLLDCDFQINSGVGDEICLDTDNGINYEKKGVVSYEGNYQDLCIDTVLEEYYCTERGHLGIEHYLCQNGCSNGACIPESELLSPASSGCIGIDCSKEMSLFERIIKFLKNLFT